MESLWTFMGLLSETFVSWVWKAFYSALGAASSLSSGYHPQTNGQTEQANQDLDSTFDCVAAQNPTKWTEHLPWNEYAHNQAMTSCATGVSLFQASLGYQPPLFCK